MFNLTKIWWVIQLLGKSLKLLKIQFHEFFNLISPVSCLDLFKLSGSLHACVRIVQVRFRDFCLKFSVCVKLKSKFECKQKQKTCKRAKAKDVASLKHPKVNCTDRTLATNFILITGNHVKTIDWHKNTVPTFIF